MQSRKASITEQIFNIGSGFIIACFVTKYILPYFVGTSISYNKSLQITFIYTIISLIRGYAWRRVFNKLTVLYLKTK